MGSAEVEGRRPKEVSRDLCGRTAAEDEASGWAGQESGRRPGNIVVVILPPPWLFGHSMDTFFF